MVGWLNGHLDCNLNIDWLSLYGDLTLPDLIRERLEMAGTTDDLFCEYEQILKAKLTSRKRKSEGAESDDDDDEEAAVENPEEDAEALKMATDAEHGAEAAGKKGGGGQDCLS